MSSNEPTPTPRSAPSASARQAEFDNAWKRVAPAVFTWASLHVRAPLRARLEPEDLLQEIACRAWTHYDTWDPARGAFRVWVFGIANNVLREVLRSMAAAKRRERPAQLSTDRWAELPDTSTRISRVVARDERLATLLERLAELPDDDRRLLIYRGLEGLPHDEVAGLLGVGLEAVAKRWQRLCARLRDQRAWSELIDE